MFENYFIKTYYTRKNHDIHVHTIYFIGVIDNSPYNVRPMEHIPESVLKTGRKHGQQTFDTCND